jgi:hypothetical protein
VFVGPSSGCRWCIVFLRLPAIFIQQRENLHHETCDTNYGLKKKQRPKNQFCFVIPISPLSIP